MYTMEDIEARFKQVTGITTDMTVFPITDGTGTQQQTNEKDRKKYGFVTTPLNLADYMVQQTLSNIDGRSYTDLLSSSDGMKQFMKHGYIDLCCGCGQFGIRILRAVVNAARGREDFSLQQFLRDKLLFIELNPECVAKAIYVFHGDLNIMIGNAMKVNMDGETNGFLFCIDGKWQQCEEFTDAVNRILSSGEDWHIMVDKIASEIRERMNEDGTWKNGNDSGSGKKRKKLASPVDKSEKRAIVDTLTGTGGSRNINSSTQNMGVQTMSESVNAMVRVISATLAEVVNENVDGECRHQLVQTARMLVDNLEQATRVTQQAVTVQDVLELPETVNPVPEKTVEEVVQVPEPQAPPEPVAQEVVQEPVKAIDDLKLERSHYAYSKFKWYLPGIVQDKLVERPMPKTAYEDMVTTVVSTDILGRLFGNADKIEFHYEVSGGKQGRKEYGVKHLVEIPLEELYNRQWTRKRVSNLHKAWFQNYKTSTGRLVPIWIDMFRDASRGTVRMEVSVAGHSIFLKNRANGNVAIGTIDDHYDPKDYERLLEIDKKDFATACGVQTVWDARNLK